MNPAQFLIKRSKRLLNAGKVEEAKLAAENALAVATRNKQLAQYIPIAEHRFAMVLKTLKQYKPAREYFERALASLDRHDPANRIGRAILLRDYGLFLGCELRSYEEGLEKVEAAKTILQGNFPANLEPRVTLEYLVTESFICRIRLKQNKFDGAALFMLKQLDVRLREAGGNKPGYQADNLAWIVRYETRAKEVNRFLPRSILLSARLGNIPRTIEYTAMAAGGQFARAGLDRVFSS